MNDKVNICGIEIDNISFQQAIDELVGCVQKKEAVYAVTPNIDHIVKLAGDSQFYKAYQNASLVLADGMPILWAASFLGTPLKEKISGSDLFPKLCQIAADRGYKVFFLGGREGAARKAAEVLRSKYPNLQVTGLISPPEGFEKNEDENKRIINTIRGSGADILFVGLGAPKQEKWIYKYRTEYCVPVSIGIGVSFEFVAGLVRRAPVWMQKTGLEWFWRFIMEPRRLWKRYLVNDTRFFSMVLKQKINNFRRVRKK